MNWPPGVLQRIVVLCVTDDVGELLEVVVKEESHIDLQGVIQEQLRFYRLSSTYER